LKQKEISLKAKCEEVHRNIIQVKQEASRFAKIGAAVYQALQNDKHLPFHLYLQFVSETLSRTKNLSDYSSFLELLLIRMLPLVPRPHWHFFLAHIIKELENSNLKPLSKAYPASMKYQEGEIDELTEVFKHVTLDSLVFEASSSSGDIDRLKQLVLGQPKTELLMYASQAIQEQHHKEKVEGNEKEQTQDNLALSPTEQVIESTTLIPPGSTWWWFRVFCALFPNCYSQWIERFLGVTDRITSPTMGNFSWHSIASKFPQDVGVVFVTPSIGSFDLLQQIFLDGLGTKEDQWNTLKLLLHRHFQTSEDFRDIFTLPRIQQPAHMLALENPNANHTAAASASPSSTSFGTSSISPGSNNEMISSSRNLMGMSPHNSTRNILVATDDTTIIELLTAVDHVLILQRPEEILKEKPEVLMQLRLVILEFFTPILQSPQEELDGITRWEGLLQLLQHSVSRTSSLCLNRNSCSMDSSAGWTNSKWSPPPRRTVAGVANSPVTNDGTTTTPQQSSQLIIKNRLVGSSSLMQPKYTRVVSVVEDMSNIPVHLRGHTLTVQWKSKSERHMAGYFKSVALRLACVPFFKHLEPMLTSSSNMILDAGVTTSTSSINGSTLAWRLLSALLLFHSLLIFRHDTIVSYPACEYPNIDYTWSEFVTAVYLLLDTVETLLHSTEMQKKKRSSNFVTLLKVVQQQILLGVYSRKGEYSGGKTTLPGSGLLLCSCELRFISNLWEECLLVMRIPTKELSSSTTGGSSAITTNNSESLHNILGVFSVSVLGRLTKPDDVLQMFLDASHQLEAFDSNRTAELKLRQFLRLEEHVQLGIIIKRPPLWLEKINYVDVEQTKSAANSILNTLLQALSFFQQEPIQENISSCQTSIIDMHWYEVARSNTICINQLKKYLESLKAQNGTKEDEEQENEQDTKQAIMLNHVPASFQRYVPWTLMNLQDFMLSLRSSYQFFSHSFTQKKIWYAPAVSSITGLIEMARLHYYETFSLASNNSPVESMTISSTTDSSVDDIEIEFYLVRAFDPVVMKEQEPDKTNDNFTLILSGLKLVGARWNEKFKVLDNIDTSSSSSTSSITLREKWEKNVWLIAKFQDKKICTTSNTTGPPFGAQGTDKKRRTFRNKALCPLVRRRGGSLEQSMKSDVETLYEFELPASSSFSPFTVPILQYTHT
jgi:hypothetical protein